MSGRPRPRARVHARGSRRGVPWAPPRGRNNARARDSRGSPAPRPAVAQGGGRHLGQRPRGATLRPAAPAPGPRAAPAPPARPPRASPQAAASATLVRARGARAEQRGAEQPAEPRPPQQWSPGAGPPPPPLPVGVAGSGSRSDEQRPARGCGSDPAPRRRTRPARAPPPRPRRRPRPGPAPRPMGRELRRGGGAGRNKGRWGGAAGAGLRGLHHP